MQIKCKWLPARYIQRKTRKMVLRCSEARDGARHTYSIRRPCSSRDVDRPTRFRCLTYYVVWKSERQGAQRARYPYLFTPASMADGFNLHSCPQARNRARGAWTTGTARVCPDTNV